MKDVCILIVDDIPEWRQSLKELISRSGYACETASSREEAINKLSKHLYKVAVVDLRLTDWDEADLGGMEIVNWLLKTKSPTKVVVLSAYVVPDNIQDLFHSGVVLSVFFKADFSLRKFIACIEEAMKSTIRGNTNGESSLHRR